MKLKLIIALSLAGAPLASQANSVNTWGNCKAFVGSKLAGIKQCISPARLNQLDALWYGCQTIAATAALAAVNLKINKTPDSENDNSVKDLAVSAALLISACWALKHFGNMAWHAFKSRTKVYVEAETQTPREIATQTCFTTNQATQTNAVTPITDQVD